MRNIHITKEPVTLTGYQAVLRPSKFGYSLKALVDSDLVDRLEEERADCLKWAESKLKNPKRATLTPTPWEEVSEGKFIVKFSLGYSKNCPRCSIFPRREKILIFFLEIKNKFKLENGYSSVNF